MWSLKKKFHRKKRHGSSASSSAHGSVSDLEDRVVMLCEDLPNESSYDSCSETLSQRSTSRSSMSRRSVSRSSQSGEQEPGTASYHPAISRDRLSYRQACYFEEAPTASQHGYYQVRRLQAVYGCFCLSGQEMSSYIFVSCDTLPENSYFGCVQTRVGQGYYCYRKWMLLSLSLHSHKF